MMRRPLNKQLLVERPPKLSGWPLNKQLLVERGPQPGVPTENVLFGGPLNKHLLVERGLAACLDRVA